jgi:hypothetical protein
LRVLEGAPVCVENGRRIEIRITAEDDLIVIVSVHPRVAIQKAQFVGSAGCRVAIRFHFASEAISPDSSLIGASLLVCTDSLDT